MRLLQKKINKLVPCYAPFFLLDLDNITSIIPKSEDDIDAKNGLTTQRYRLLAHQTRFEAKNLPRVGADKAHFNYSKFFNSSISGKACFNFSGISSEVLYVATPNGLS